MTAEPTTPKEVWALIERADELIKYASNRDQQTAFAQARSTLERAIAAAKAVTGAGALEQQARTRLEDLARLEQGAGA